MKKKITLISLTGTSIILMFFPDVAMNFSDGYNTFMIYHSYFNLTPFLYAHWFPMFTAISSIIVLILHIKNITRGALIWQSICVLTSLLAWAGLIPYNGLLNVTVIGVMISVLHIAALIIQIIFYN